MNRCFQLARSAAVVLLAALALVACTGQGEANSPADQDEALYVVATTNIIGDLVEEIGGGQVRVESLMGPGVDPHLYRASEGDVRRMRSADAIFYNGLHLEGRMADLLERMSQGSRPTVAVAEGAVPDSLLIRSADFPGNYDPHVWLDVGLWQEAARYVAEELAAVNPAHKEAYHANAEAYLAEMEELERYVMEEAARVPEEQRVLITSHDAFGYFGRAYGFEVRGLVGLSTAVEAGAGDVQRLASFVAERQIPALFVETSVSERGIEAVQQAVRARDFEVEIGGMLYGDALGDPGTPGGTYLGMVRHNIDTIVAGLLDEPV